MAYACGNGMMLTAFAHGASTGAYMETRISGTRTYQARLIPSGPYGLVSVYCEGNVDLVQVVGTGMGFDHLAPYPRFPDVQGLLGLAGILCGFLFAYAIVAPFARGGR